MRKKIYNFVYVPMDKRDNDWYDWLMLIITIISIIPLMSHRKDIAFFVYIDIFVLIMFIVDYFLRLLCADMIFPKTNKVVSFLLYPFTVMAIIDLISIVSLFSVLNSELDMFKTLRLFQIVRVFKLFRYSKTAMMILNVFKQQKDALIAVFNFAIAYIFLSALVVFNVEPDSFGDFFDALYWATVSLTTVGYGDIYPVTTIGRMVTMISSILGIAIVTLPAGIISAGYIHELRKEL